jgi:hypothetical protein
MFYRIVRHLRLALVGCTLAGASCHMPHSDPIQESFRVPGTNVTLPKAQGWVRDRNLAPTDGVQGGTVLRLVRQGDVPGSPRIDVVTDAQAQPPTLLEDYLTRNLRDMGQLEASGSIHIVHVDQQRIMVGTTPAYRVHHEYTAGKGASQVSLYQVSTFIVVDGKGLTVTAAGRTELFHPLGRSIADILDGMAISGKGAVSHPDPAPIDLGQVGGRRR